MRSRLREKVVNRKKSECGTVLENHVAGRCAAQRNTRCQELREGRSMETILRTDPVVGLERQQTIFNGSFQETHHRAEIVHSTSQTIGIYPNCHIAMLRPLGFQARHLFRAPCRFNSTTASPPLLAQLRTDLKTAMKAKDAVRLLAMFFTCFSNKFTKQLSTS